MKKPAASTLRKNPLKLWQSTWPIAEQPLSVEVGDLYIQICRLAHEWQLHYHWNKNGNTGKISADYVDAPAEPDLLPERVAMETMSKEIVLAPKLADRSIVVRPYSPFIIPANNNITLFVSTPLWLSINFSADVCRELPVRQLSDTWMGLMTGEGELCYGSQTHARLDEEKLLPLPYQALTPITLRNKGDEDITLQRLSIPTRYLSLYAGRNQLLTDPLSIVMDSVSHQGIVEIGTLTDKDPIAPPRDNIDKGILVNTWENLFA